MSVLELHFVVLEGEDEQQIYVRLDEIVAVIGAAGDGSCVYVRQDPKPIIVANDPEIVLERMATTPRQTPR